MFSEINISVTPDSQRSWLSGPDISGTVCNLSGKALESMDALLDGRSDNSSAGGKEKETVKLLKNLATGARIYNSIPDC